MKHYYGYAINDFDLATSVAAILEHMTGEHCKVIQRGKSMFVIERNNGSGGVIA